MTPEQNAIVLFAKKPEPGKVKTRLAAGVGEARAVEMYRAMVEHTVAEARAIDATCWLYYAPDDAGRYMRNWLGEMLAEPQDNGDLGDRMLGAFKDGLGAKTVIVGTDCPALDRRVMEAAFSALEEVDVVLGPTFDGGYYLIGAKQAHPELFRNMVWSTEQVLEQTLARAAMLGVSVRLLGKLHDIDTEDDLPHYTL